MSIPNLSQKELSYNFALNTKSLAYMLKADIFSRKKDLDDSLSTSQKAKCQIKYSKK